MPQEYILEINGQLQRVESEPDTPLLYVLRNDLGLKGVKYGCGSEQCGACKVIVDGQAVPTCKLPVKNVQGLSITTIEGLSQTGDLHALQQAFLEEQAGQCGYCTPGMILAAQSLLNQLRYPTNEEIKAALEDNLCRCGAYDRVRRAIRLRIGRPDRQPKYTVLSDPESLSKYSASQPSAELPPTLVQTPDLDDWIRINNDETITLFTGKVELGQGIKTAVGLIGAEELDVSLERIRLATTDTLHSPDEGLTVGSMSLETTGEAMRYAAAEARQVLLSIAFEELEAPIEKLVVTDGTIRDPVSGRSTTYWELMGGQSFVRQVSGVGRPKSPKQYSLLGNANKRIDLVDKVSGAQTYIQDLDLPGMVHGRVLRPPHYDSRLISFDEQRVSQLPGVLKIVRDGSFLGVICEREEQALKALEKLRATSSWAGELDLPSQDSLYEHMLNQSNQSFLVQDGTPVEGAIPPIETQSGAADILRATYYRPFQMHASLGPSAAAAQLVDGKLTMWVQSQGVYPIRAAVAHVLGMPESEVRVIHVEGAGCYGHNGADDAALDAALLARAYPGRPVSLKWTRADEHTWEPYGPAMVMQLQASLGPAGEVIDWNHDVWSYPHLGRSRVGGDTSGLLAAWHLAEPYSRAPLKPVLAPHVGSHRNADPLYAFPRRRIVKHFIPDSPLRVSALRGLGAYGNVFAIESFMDELAHKAGIDPVEFRLRQLEDERARAVIAAAANKANWRTKTRDQADGFGQGMAFAQYKNRQCYTAVVVDLEVDRSTGQITLERAIIAADAGQIVSADGLSNQLEGSFVQAASWTLNEEVSFNQEGVTSRDWDSYPILRFPQAPKIETVLLNRPGLPFLGSGEAAQGPTPAAIANAVFAALGVRLREIPFTPERVRAALNEN
jgi:CO/xanthine dehydrogenase Mo-binding subunit/aerobic-type carbon monoxide dehydrogenase small subunit (CoxS/CutS family)